MKAISIKTKLVLAIVAALALVAIAVAAVVRGAAERNVRLVGAEAIRAAGGTFAAMQRADVEKLDATLSALGANPAFAEAFAARDRERLLALAAPVFAGLRAQHDITHWYFLDPAPARTCFLRVHKPEQHGDVVGRATLAQAVETAGRGAGMELGQTAFALRVVRPLSHAGAALGYVELGEEVDHFLGRMSAQTGDAYALVVEKRFLDRAAWAATREGRRDPWDDQPATVVVDATSDDPALTAFQGDLSAVPEEGQLVDELERGGRTLARGLVPVRDAAGRRVGALFVLHDITDVHATFMRARTRVFAVICAMALLLALVLVVLLQRLVFGRLGRMVSTMEDLSARLAGGDYDVAAPPPGPPDEIGRFEDFFGRFLAVVGGQLKELTRRRTG
ncbi:cache domain-containing protein [Anaeromyxobacter sp. PSR-1]|uniref:cache domain-containing protein n=1 Tax=unclassified Anaeromyxobacter TaxID=2620896 RepID=UPI0005E76B6D|nr:cache domain-containing protein [Anaeromyxobacter sp. PSR-1]GAO04161.1 HAMP domain protein [Anaeromyxobacter sp. PSR-1]